MAADEKLFNIPLRKEWLKKARVARANRAVDTVRSFLEKHMKTEEVKISQSLNESLWIGGAKRPPAFAKVKVVKDEKGKVIALMPDEKLEFTEKKGLKHKLLRKKGDVESKIVKEEAKIETATKEEKKTEEKPTASKVVEKKEEVKPIQENK